MILFLATKMLNGQNMMIWALLMFMATVTIGTLGMPLVKKLNIEIGRAHV